MTLNHQTLEGRLIWLSFALAIAYWVVESVVDFVLFGRNDLWHLLFPFNDLEEMWKRLLFLFIIVSFGIYSRWSVAKLRRVESSLKQSYEGLGHALEGTVQAMAKTVEMRDAYTSGHQQRVAGLACAIAREMGLSEERIKAVRLSASIHDIGKISVPAEILSRPGRISEAEFRLIQDHPAVAHEILEPVDFPWPIAKIVLQHHEKVNGSGYPSGLRGEDILLESRILSVADVVEAMSSHRPYRPALGLDKALGEISLNSDILYDRNVVDACLKVFTQKQFEFAQDPSSSVLPRHELAGNAKG